MKVGRILAGAVVGLLFLLFVAFDLVLFGVVPLNNVLVTILPALGLVLGAVLGGLAGNRQKAAAPPSSPPPSPPGPAAFAPPTPL